MAYATPADVEARLGRDLTVEEAAQVAVLLNDAEVLIKTRVPDLDALVADGTIDEALVVMVECNMVIRVLRNPEAFIAEQDGNYSYQRTAESAAGYLSLSDLEWSWLIQDNGMFQIVPIALGTGAPYEGYPNHESYELSYNSCWPGMSSTWRTWPR
jgi:hypothetical protein